jgi:hypothetical protein
VDVAREYTPVPDVVVDQLVMDGLGLIEVVYVWDDGKPGWKKIRDTFPHEEELKAYYHAG